MICHFPIGILGQVWYLIVLIPNLSTLTYFKELPPLDQANPFAYSCSFTIYTSNTNDIRDQRRKADKMFKNIIKAHKSYFVHTCSLISIYNVMYT